MQLINMPIIEETGVYLIPTDIEPNPDEGIESEIEFYVHITTDIEVDRYDDMPPDIRLVDVYIVTTCLDPGLDAEVKYRLEGQLKDHLQDHYDRMIDRYS